MRTDADIATALANLRRFSARVILIAACLSAIAAVGAAFYNPVIAKGIILGALASMVGFWVLTGRVARLPQSTPQKVVMQFYRSMFVRVALYGAALYAAYRLDTVGMRGMLAAAATMVGLHGVLLAGAVLSRFPRRTAGE